jgi:hypothetical protein
MGVPVWVLEGYPTDQPPIESLIRTLEFNRIEQSRKDGHG